jgi:chitinase
VAPERSGNVADYGNYVSFLKNLKAALTASGHDYGLSITIPASYWYLQNFDIVNIEPIVDWFNMMTYDLHGVWDSTDVWIGAIVQAHTNLTEIDSAMQLLWRNGINPANVNMGLGFYGRSFTLANPGPCTQTAGVLSDSEIVDIIATEGATVVTDAVAAVEIATWGGNQWVSYDSVATFRQKIEWANSHCLGGSVVYKKFQMEGFH